MLKFNTQPNPESSAVLAQAPLHTLANSFTAAKSTFVAVPDIDLLHNAAQACLYLASLLTKYGPVMTARQESMFADRIMELTEASSYYTAADRAISIVHTQEFYTVTSDLIDDLLEEMSPRRTLRYRIGSMLVK